MWLLADTDITHLLSLIIQCRELHTLESDQIYNFWKAAIFGDGQTTL